MKPLLKKLVKLDSYTYNRSGVNSMGEFLREELDFMTCKVFSSEIDNKGDLYIFESEDFGKTDGTKILLSGHTDTVTELNQEYKEEAGKIYGLGTQDMKGGLSVIVKILKQLYSIGKLSNVAFSVTPDEERGSATFSSKLKEYYKQFDYGFVFEASTSFYDKDGKFLPEKRSLVTARKGGGVAEFRIYGKAGHSGVITKEEERISANVEAAYKVVALHELQDFEKDTTLNPGVMIGGKAPNIFSDFCDVKSDMRILEPKEFERIYNAVEELAKKTFVKGTRTDLELKEIRPPMAETENTEKVKSMASEVAKALGFELVFETRGGFSDANNIADCGVTVFDGLGPQGEGEHTDCEYIFEESLQTSYDFAYQLISKVIGI